ncbi:MAG TPA: DUF2892 domain-containing protein [Dissulfurispiraceae bacterium]|nr:DUF2892 domain-containing protein [Dissulfurispiraceae bacterium]
MKTNEGTLDRALRVVAGAALIAYAIISGSVWAYIGIVPLLTGIVGICPLYGILGISTCGKCSDGKSGSGCACEVKH